MNTIPGLTEWEPLGPGDIDVLFDDFPGSWCIAGGWAIELAVGHEIRPHADVDVAISRRDLPILHRHLPGWLLYAALDGELTLWEADTPLREGAHDIWCRRPGHQWEFQFMVNDPTATEWVFRRDQRVRAPLASSIRMTGGLPVLAPELQLLYKSRPWFRAKDEIDFAAILPVLAAGQREWLAANLRLLYGDHPWLPKLEVASARSLS